MSKKELTPTQQKKRYKRLANLCFGGEFLATATPFVAIGVAKYEEYFVQYDGTRMSLACVLAFAVMGLAIWIVAQRKFENSFITLLVGWAAMTGIFWLMGRIINDIAFIMSCGFFGLLAAYGLDITHAKLKKKAEEIQKGIDRAKEEMTADAYKEEVKTVKLKIKK